MPTDSLVPTERDPTKPWHWSFQSYLLEARGWTHHHIDYSYFYPNGGMVSIESIREARESWLHEVFAAWQRGEAIHADAAADLIFSDGCKPPYGPRNGAWRWKPAPPEVIRRA